MIVLAQLCYLWCADRPPALSPRDAAIAYCFQTQPWHDPDNEKLDACLAAIPNNVWRAR